MLESNLLSSEAVAQHLGCTVEYVLGLIREQKLTASFVARKWRVQAAHLQQFIDDSRTSRSR